MVLERHNLIVQFTVKGLEKHRDKYTIALVYLSPLPIRITETRYS